MTIRFDWPWVITFKCYDSDRRPVVDALVLVVPKSPVPLFGHRVIAAGATGKDGIVKIILTGFLTPAGEYVSFEDDIYAYSPYFVPYAYWNKTLLFTRYKPLEIFGPRTVEYFAEVKVPPRAIYDLWCHVYTVKLKFFYIGFEGVRKTIVPDLVEVAIPTGEIRKIKPISPELLVAKQIPHGTLTVKVYYRGVLVFEGPIEVSRHTAEEIKAGKELTLKVYDFKVAIIGKIAGGVPLAGAKVKVEAPGVTKEITLDAAGESELFERVPAGKVKVTIIEWKGIDIGVTLTFDLVESKKYILSYDKIGYLQVSVKDEKGKVGLPKASVVVKYGGKIIESGTTDENGIFTAILPAKTYTVEVNFKGVTASESVTITAGATATKEFRMKGVYMVLWGRPITLGTLITIIVGIIILIIVIVILLHEYALYRRRKIAVALAPPAK